MAMKTNNEEIKERLLKARALSDEKLAKVTGGSIIDEKCLCECKNCNAMTCCVDGSPCECGGTFKSVKK